jgi:quercetin dioxygenase-like cupin family protein
MRITMIFALVLALTPLAPVSAQPASPTAFSCETLAHRQVIGGTPPIAVRVVKQTSAPGKVPLMHRHKVGEIIYVLSGTGTNTMNGKTTALSADSAVVVPAGTEHAIGGTGSAGVTVISVQMTDTKSSWFSTKGSNKPPKACRD